MEANPKNVTEFSLSMGTSTENQDNTTIESGISNESSIDISQYRREETPELPEPKLS